MHDFTTMTDRLAALREGWTPQDFSLRQRIPEGKIMVLADAHIPYHDEQLLADALLRAQSQQVEAIVWLGDLLDNPTFSSWGVDDLTTTFERELRIAEGVIRAAAEVTPRQYWSLGNHEERWMRKLGFQTGMTHLARIAGLDDLLRDGRLVVSDNPTWDYLDGRWMLTHPADYAGQPLAVPGIIADHFDQHVVSAHAHHWAKGKSPSGKYTVIESGGLFQPNLVKYIQHRVTRHRSWTQGYVMLDYGTSQLIEGLNH